VHHPKNGILMFPLCRSCCDNLDHTQAPCRHNPEERALLGTWTSVELHYALEHGGYIILEVYQIIHFPEAHYVFREYVRKFLILRYMAAGWPEGIDKQEYLRLLWEKEGITLEEKDIQKNQAMYIFSKLLINALYGKFAQDVAKSGSKVNYITDTFQLFKLLNDPKVEISNFEILSESVAACWTSSLTQDIPKAQQISNPVISSFVAANARITLHKHLHKLGRRVIYFDTDSVIALTNPRTDSPDLLPDVGLFLGQWKSELGGGEHIVGFVSLASKCYSFYTNKKRSEVKLRGISLRQSGLVDTMTFDVLKSLFLGHLDEIKHFPKFFNDLRARTKDSRIGKATTLHIPGIEDELIVPDSKMKRGIDGSVFDSPEDQKILRVNYNKRRLILFHPDIIPGVQLSSEPWGFR